MDELKKYWNKWSNWILLFLKSLGCLICLGLLFIVGNLNNNMFKVLISIFLLAALIYSFVSLFVFTISNVKKCKEKTKFSWFTIIYVFIFVVIAIVFRDYFHLLKYNDIMENINGKNLNLFSLMTADFLIAASFLLLYFVLCLIVIKRFRILLIEKSLRSALVAITAWLLVGTNISIISTKGNNLSELFLSIYIVVSSITTLLYPFFDIFEFTYKQLNEIEKEQVMETERAEIERTENRKSKSKKREEKTKIIVVKIKLFDENL